MKFTNLVPTFWRIKRSPSIALIWNQILWFQAECSILCLIILLIMQIKKGGYSATEFWPAHKQVICRMYSDNNYFLVVLFNVLFGGFVCGFGWQLTSSRERFVVGHLMWKWHILNFIACKLNNALSIESWQKGNITRWKSGAQHCFWPQDERKNIKKEPESNCAHNLTANWKEKEVDIVT